MSLRTLKLPSGWLTQRPYAVRSPRCPPVLALA